MRTTLVGCFLALVLTSCGSGSGGADGTTTETAEVGPSAAEVEPTSTGPAVTELVAAEWSEFCASDTSLVGSPTDSWADNSQSIEAALAPGGTSTTDDGAALLALLRTATDKRGALSSAIDAAIASQTGVDCSTGNCTVLVFDEGVLMTNFVEGFSGGLEVDEELSAFRVAIDNLAAKAQELGLDDCSLLAGDDGDNPEVDDE